MMEITVYNGKYECDLGAGAAARARHGAANAGQASSFDACVGLFEWVRSNGGMTASVTITSNNGLRGLAATVDIARDGHVIEMPQNLLLTLARATKSRAGIALAPIADQLYDLSILATDLILARRDRDFAHWYVEALPSALDKHPVLCDDELSKTILGISSAGIIAAELKMIVREDYRRISNLLPAADLFDLDEFGWAFCNVLSRAFTLKIGSADFQPTIVPVVCMMNHSAHPNCKLRVSGDVVHVDALTDITRGDELTISYGVRANIEMLAVWGFCTEGNPERRAALAVPAITDRRFPLLSLNAERNGASPRFWSGIIAPSYSSLETQALFAFLRSRQAFRLEDQPGNACADSFSHPKTRLNEIGALRDLLAACNKQAASIRERVASLEAGARERLLAHMAELAAHSELKVLSHFACLAESAIAVLEIDDSDRARAALHGIADDGYLAALRLSWDTLWTCSRERVSHPFAARNN
jgi:hypothetical protein